MEKMIKYLFILAAVFFMSLLVIIGFGCFSCMLGACHKFYCSYFCYVSLAITGIGFIASLFFIFKDFLHVRK